MTRGQEAIMRYVSQNFVGGSIRMEAVVEDKVRVTNRTGEHMTLTMNLYCDILDADNGQLYAKSDLPHDILRIGTKMPPHGRTSKVKKKGKAA